MLSVPVLAAHILRADVAVMCSLASMVDITAPPDEVRARVEIPVRIPYTPLVS